MEMRYNNECKFWIFICRLNIFIDGIYDDRLLVKPIKSAISYMPTATYELPYDGAKEMLLVVQ